LFIFAFSLGTTTKNASGKDFTYPHIIISNDVQVKKL